MSDQEAAPPAKSSRLPMIVGAVVVLLLGGGAGAGAMYFLGGSGAPPATEGEQAAAEGEEASAEGEAKGEGEGEEGEGGEGKEAKPALALIHGNRSVVNLGTFTVNLRGSGGGRVLRTEVQVEVSAKDSEAIEDHKPVLRDAVITLASDFTYGDLEGVDGKTHLRDELLGRLNTVLEGKPTVDRLYFTEFVVQ
jgi:flagellar FliL protein